MGGTWTPPARTHFLLRKCSWKNPGGASLAKSWSFRSRKMRSRVGALMQAVATTSAALLRGGSTRVGARGSTLRMAQVDTGGLGAPDICVLGGGFGGLYTALRLSKLDWGDAPRPRVTLVDQQERFVFLPMLYEVATGAASCWEVTLAHCRAARPLTLSPHAHAGAHAYPNPQP